MVNVACRDMLVCSPPTSQLHVMCLFIAVLRLNADWMAERRISYVDRNSLMKCDFFCGFNQILINIVEIRVIQFKEYLKYKQ